MVVKMVFYMNLVAAFGQNAAHAFVTRTTTARGSSCPSKVMRYMSSSSSSSMPTFAVSRISTLQTLLNKAGAPGSHGCNQPNDLQPVDASTDEDKLKLHPHLFPIAKSQANPDHYICALRRAYADDALYESSTDSPWPIVESTLGGPGYRLLSLNSEHFMRRIAAHVDDEDGEGGEKEIIDIYNKELGQGLSDIVDPKLDSLYEPGSVAKLGYGASKYILLRVGPFPDLYEEMALSHSKKNDEASSLIAAEASNDKFAGFASTYKFYGELLSSLPNRVEETRDAARVCLRLPIPSIGMYDQDFIKVSQLAQLTDGSDDVDMKTALTKMSEMYEKIKTHEEEEEQNGANMTPEQTAIEEANQILDRMVLQTDSERDWSSIRKELGEVYASAGLDDMADFVDPSRE